MDERTLIQAARQGDLDAFNQLVLDYQNLLYQHACYLLGNQQDAEDATQDAFIQAYRNLGTYRGGSFRAWLMRIVTNLCYDELRRVKRQAQVGLYHLDEDGEEIESPSWLADPGLKPESALERAELRHKLQDYLDELPPAYRIVILLVDVDQLEYAEAATILGVPIGTVKSRLARARHHLRNWLQAAPDFSTRELALA